MRLPRRFQNVAFVFFMALTMSMIMSAIVTMLNLGWAGFPLRWLRAWGIAFSFAFPLILILAPVGQRFAAAITERN